jgi:L-galactose dehydrogenase
MFVVRRIFSDPAYFAETVAKLRAEGQLPPGEDDPLAFLVHAGGAADVMDAAYRFARHQPGADVVLFGTGSIAHLERNVASILKPPLPEADLAELYRRFGHLEGVGLDLPRR